MSVTCEFVVITPGWNEDKESMRAVNLALHIADTERRQTFNKLDDKAAGGSKCMSMEIWAACFNHFIPGDVIAALVEAEWRFPERIFVCHDPGDYMAWDGWGEDYVPPWTKTIQRLREESHG